jgi:hypothetical protein
VNIRVEIKGTEPGAKDGTYVYDTGDIGTQDLHRVMRDLENYLLRSMLELRKLKVMA